MKRYLYSFILIVLSGVYLMAQAPQAFNFTGFAKGKRGHPLILKEITVQVSILDESEIGPVLYQEIHQTYTGLIGRFTVKIGRGDPDLGSFADIDWSTGSKFLEIALNRVGSELLVQGVIELLSVPYALYGEDADSDPTNEIQDLFLEENLLVITDNDGATAIDLTPYLEDKDEQQLSIDGYELTLSNGGTVILPDSANDADADPLNEIQTIGLDGHFLNIVGGNTIQLPDSANDADSDPGNELQSLLFEGTEISISDGNTIDLSVLQDGVDDEDSDPLNELQLLSISNDTIFLSDGGFVKLPPSTALTGIYFYADKDGDGFGNPFSPVYVPSGVSAPLGFIIDDLDCDDENPGINPDATEVLGDGIDSNCDGIDGTIEGLDIDDDGDGYSENQGDCDDGDASISPDATDIPNDGIDQDCNGEDFIQYWDAFMLSWGHDKLKVVAEVKEITGLGLNAAKALVDNVPVTIVERVSQDSAWVVKSLLEEVGAEMIVQLHELPNLPNVDDDGDGYTEEQGDCDDSNSLFYPGAIEPCEHGFDKNCDGLVGTCDSDNDLDGYTENQGDCNDNNPGINPSIPDICEDGIDQNCDGTDAVCGVDNDGDGFEVSEGDCNDDDNTIYPGASEIPYDGIDQNCDGADDILYDVILESAGHQKTEVIQVVRALTGLGLSAAKDLVDSAPVVFESGIFDTEAEYIQNELEAVGAIVQVIPSQNIDLDGDGVTIAQGDCNDNDPSVYPGATEIPGDGIDQDCDAGYICPDDGILCTAEVYNADDNSCSSVIDAGMCLIDGICYISGATDPENSCMECDHSSNSTDWTPRQAGVACDDGDTCTGDTYCDGTGQCVGSPIDCDDGDPDTEDTCDGASGCVHTPIDNDLDGYPPSVDCDDTDPNIFPGAVEVCGDGIDQDCDGEDLLCPPLDVDNDGDGLSENQGDCDDSNPNVYPGANEICDGLDNDCDGLTLQGELTDIDGDGSLACLDCNDNDPNNYPGNTETCDGLDNDCDGSPASFEVDADGDGFLVCDDCDDNDVDINPGATEVYDGVDNNCDGSIDEGVGYPTAFDWRVEIPGSISPVKQQGNCGVCWVFAPLGMIEARANIEAHRNVTTMPLYDLSEKHVMSCYNDIIDPTWTWCNGSYPPNTLKFVRDHGVLLESCYQYDILWGPSNPEPCPTDCVDPSIPMDKLRINGYQIIYNPSIEDIKTEIEDNGPVVITFDVYDDLQSYSSGIYSYTSGGLQGGTARIIVGWGSEGTTDYWIVKMDWGDNWGESGYVRMNMVSSNIRYDYIYVTTGSSYLDPEI